MGGRPGGEERAGAIRSVFEPAMKLAITMEEQVLVIEESSGKVRRLRPNGKTYKTDNGSADLKARWDDGALRIETRPGRGGKVEETWTVSEDLARIEIETKLEMGRGKPVTLRRAYDRTPADTEH
jgi:hypothetical protein